MRRLATILLVPSLLLPIPALAFKCNVCHSKNPAMVRMHRAVQEKEIGCFDCHSMSDKLMGKGKPKDQAALHQRRETEPVCVGCHPKK
jgi:hypothetical protein